MHSRSLKKSSKFFVSAEKSQIYPHFTSVNDKDVLIKRNILDNVNQILGKNQENQQEI